MKSIVIAASLIATSSAFALSSQELNDWADLYATATVANEYCNAKINMKQVVFTAENEGLTDSDMAVVRKNAATKIAKIKSDFIDKGLTENWCKLGLTGMTETEFSNMK
jgi:hypothetical protein